MKKINSKKLTFQMQTVRLLDQQDLAEVAGGATTMGVTFGCPQSGRPACRTTVTVSHRC